MIRKINCFSFFSRQESQSRGSDETLSSPRSPEGKASNYFKAAIQCEGQRY